MQRLAAITIFCMLPLSAAIAETLELNDLPGLPISAVSQADAKAKKQQVSVGNGTYKASSTSASDFGAPPRELSVVPGVNEIIPIAVTHTNRIMMPFENPRIRTTSDAGFDVDGRAVYITSTTEGRPVTVFVNEADNPELALSLTFVPSKMPPVEVDLKIDENHLPVGGLRSTRAKAWEESQPYVETIRDVLREVAIGKTPQSYTLSNKPDLIGFQGCHQGGLTFDFSNGQTVSGYRLMVNVGLVENKSNQVIEVREPSCVGDDVKAVAAWPNPILRPGEKTEIYVVRGVQSPDKVPYNARRSLLQE